jgi:hypothetical protein
MHCPADDSLLVRSAWVPYCHLVARHCRDLACLRRRGSSAPVWSGRTLYVLSEYSDETPVLVKLTF